MDVLLAPGVVLLAHARGSGLGWSLRLEPRDELCGRLGGGRDRLLKLGTGLLRVAGQGLELLELNLHGARAREPKIVRVAGQVAARLRQERRNDRQLPGQALLLGVRERKTYSSTAR